MLFNIQNNLEQDLKRTKFAAVILKNNLFTLKTNTYLKKAES
jgi:hypothetical protein